MSDQDKVNLNNFTFAVSFISTLLRTEMASAGQPHDPEEGLGIAAFWDAGVACVLADGHVKLLLDDVGLPEQDFYTLVGYAVQNDLCLIMGLGDNPIQEVNSEHH